MATSKKLVWDETGRRLWEIDLRNGILFSLDPKTGKYLAGVAWNGLISFTEQPGGAEPQDGWADGMKYYSIPSPETFGASIEAYNSPNEFRQHDGMASPQPGMTIGQQTRVPFAMAYITSIGNDVEYQDFGFKVSIVYGLLAGPAERARTTITESPQPITLSWTCTSTPVAVEGFKPTSIVTLNSLEVSDEAMNEILEKLHGSETVESTLLMPKEISEILSKSPKVPVTPPVQG